MSSDDELNVVLTKFGAPSGMSKVDRSERDRWRVFRKDLKHLLHKKQLQARLDEGELIVETLQERANKLPPNLLLNEAVNIKWERIKQLEKGLGGEDEKVRS